MKRAILLLVATGVIAGCATTAGYEEVLNAWVGFHIDDLVSSWGPPQGSFKLSDGSMVLEYTQTRNVQMGGDTYSSPQTSYHSGLASAYGSTGSAYGTYSGSTTTYVQKQTPTYNLNLWCKTRFTANPNGIITKWRWQGNNCIA